MKKNDFSTVLSFLLLLFCFITLFLAVKFELDLKENLFTLCAGLFMVFFGLLLSVTTKIKWTDYAKRQGK